MPGGRGIAAAQCQAAAEPGQPWVIGRALREQPLRFLDGPAIDRQASAGRPRERVGGRKRGEVGLGFCKLAEPAMVFSECQPGRSIARVVLQHRFELGRQVSRADVIAPAEAPKIEVVEAEGARSRQQLILSGQIGLSTLDRVQVDEPTARFGQVWLQTDGMEQSRLGGLRDCARIRPTRGCARSRQRRDQSRAHPPVRRAPHRVFRVPWQPRRAANVRQRSRAQWISKAHSARLPLCLIARLTNEPLLSSKALAGLVAAVSGNGEPARRRQAPPKRRAPRRARSTSVIPSSIRLGPGWRGIPHWAGSRISCV